MVFLFFDIEFSRKIIYSSPLDSIVSTDFILTTSALDSKDKIYLTISK